MRQALEHWLNQVWYGPKPPPLWLRALTPIFRLGSGINRQFQRLRRPVALFGAPLIVVGNLTAGGSGKTPLVIRLCQVFAQAGLKPGVISRGYGRSSRGLLRVNADSDPAQVGDEPVLLARRTGAPVIVAHDRCAAARALLRTGVQVVIADDGLQHYRLPRTVEICVVDQSRQFGNGRLQPAGPLREPVSRLATVDYIVVNAGSGRPESTPATAALPAGRLVSMQLLPGWLRSLDGELSWRITQFSGCRVNALAGIGNPQRFFETLRQAGLKTIEFAFPDHHSFSAADFAALNSSLPVIMTEKDAIKCAAMNLKNAWYLTVDAALPAEFEAELVARIRATSMSEQPHGRR